MSIEIKEKENELLELWNTLKDLKTSKADIEAQITTVVSKLKAHDLYASVLTDTEKNEVK